VVERTQETLHSADAERRRRRHCGRWCSSQFEGQELTIYNTNKSAEFGLNASSEFQLGLADRVGQRGPKRDFPHQKNNGVRRFPTRSCGPGETMLKRMEHPISPVALWAPQAPCRPSKRAIPLRANGPHQPAVACISQRGPAKKNFGPREFIGLPPNLTLSTPTRARPRRTRGTNSIRFHSHSCNTASINFVL
jgi:hypothetical protein